MNVRFQTLRSKIVSGAAALAISAIFIGAAVGPAVTAGPAFAAADIAVERAA